MATAADQTERLRAAVLAQPGAVERTEGIKFPCPACREEGHDKAGDNAILFTNGKWGCALAKGTDLGRQHWQAIGEALGAFSHRNGSSPPPGSAAGPADSSAGLNGRVAVIIPAATVRSEQLDWIDPGRVAVGTLTMGVGLPDQGKTLVACDFTARLSTGSPLAPARRQPGVTRPRHVVIMTNEDALGTTMVPRLLKAGADLEHISFVQMVRDADGAMSLLTLAEDIDALEEVIASTKPALVIIDGVVGYIGPDVKSHNDADVRRVLTPFAAMLARTGTAGLGLMHPPKAVTNLHYYAGGSIAFTAVPRVVLGVAPDPEDESDNPRRFLAKLKGNLYGRVPTLAFRITAEHDGAIPWIEWEPEPVAVNLADLFDPPKESPEDRGSRRRCEAWLRAHLADGPQHAKDVEAAAVSAGFSRNTLRRAREVVCDTVKVGHPGGPQAWDWLLRQEKAS